jgi:hypothetical protein
MRMQMLLAAALFAAAPAWAFHKCKGPNGNVVYQATACQEAGELVGAEIARREAEHKAEREAEAKQRQISEETSRRTWAEYESKQKQRQQLCGGQIHDMPFVGMTVHAMENCTRFWERYGAGAHVNETETARSVSRQYVFRVGGIKYLYTDGGKVTAIQR